MRYVEVLEATLNTLPARIGLLDRDLRVVFANTTGEVRVSLPRAALVGRHLTELVRPEDLARTMDSVDRALGGERYHSEQRLSHPGAYDAYLDVFVLPWPEVDRPQGVVTYSEDCTARVLAQQQTRQASEEAAVLAERQRIAADLDQRTADTIDAVSAELSRVLGTGLEVPRELRDAALRRLDEVIATLRATITRLRAETPDQEAGPALETPQVFDASLAQSVPESDPSGVPVDTLESVLDVLPLAVTVWDRDLRNEFANRAALEWFSVPSREAMAGRSLGDFLDVEDPRLGQEFAGSALAGRPTQLLRSIRGPDGVVRHVQVDYLPLRVRGEVVGMVAKSLDVSREIEAEWGLRQSLTRVAVLRDRERIAENLHDLVIQRLFCAELLCAGERGGDPDRVRLAVDSITDATRELRISVHGDVAAGTSVDLRTAAERVVRSASRVLDAEPVLTWAGIATTVPIGVGADALAALNEALSNAVRHGQAEHVQVAIELDNGTLRLRVEDDGRGMAGGSSAAGGGLGLANLRARAQRHGGSFAHHEREAGGTVVEWLVPLPATETIPGS